MGSAEAENVSKYLKTKDIQLPSNNKWLLDCINWYKSHLELRNIYPSLQDYVCIQWLLSDLRDVEHRSLPTNCKDGVVQLTSKYCVQVNWVRDISQPCYTQLQALRNNNISDSNDNVTTEETKKQNWEPSPKRVLMMEVTDGFTTLKAMEHSPIPTLTEPFIPGFKVVLVGPIECRKGILLLKNNNINLLGGEVDCMSDMYSKENMLSRCLNIVPPDNNNDGLARNSIPARVSPPRQNVVTPPIFNDVDQLPDSTSFIEGNDFESNRDAMMGYDDDVDDDLLCQLPDTVFNDAGNCAPQPSQLSPVLDSGPPEEVETSTLDNVPDEMPVLHSKPKNLNKPKLFPSMEDLRTTDESSKIRQPSLGAVGGMSRINHLEASSSSKTFNTCQNTLKSTSLVSKNEELFVKHSDPFGSAHNRGKSPRKVEQKPMESFDNHQNLDDSISNHIDNMLGETVDENVYPQFKRVTVKVISITKLKIRNGEWTCCASASIDGKTENVTFCNKLLEKLFGTSAVEVEVLRSEMAKNQSLKEKINDILKMGQTKLKLLHCLMIVEYTSEGCTPNIVSIHEE